MKNNIARIRKEKGMSQSDLGELMGYTWQTVLNHEQGRGLTTKKIDEYARKLGVAPYEILAATDETRMVRVAGLVQAGAWAESVQFDDDEVYEVAIPNDRAFKHFRLEGREVRGPSMNKRYPERTVVVITDLVETGEDIQVGKRYVVERERADGLREATVKLLWRDANGRRWLVPESDDPTYQEAIPFDGGEGDTIRIVGRVRYAVSRED